MIDEPESWPPRKLTREQARMEEHVFWSTRTVAERLHAAAALTRRLLLMRGIDPDERTSDLTARRVSRRGR